MTYKMKSSMPAMSMRFLSVYLALTGIAVAVHFMIYPLYAYDDSGESGEGELAVWLVFDWFMAAGLFLMLITTLAAKRAANTDHDAVTREWLVANLMFYGTVILALAFVPNWFAVAWGHGTNWTVWHIIDTVLPVMFTVQACRIWRNPNAHCFGCVG